MHTSMIRMRHVHVLLTIRNPPPSRGKSVVYGTQDARHSHCQQNILTGALLHQRQSSPPPDTPVCTSCLRTVGLPEGVFRGVTPFFDGQPPETIFLQLQNLVIITSDSVPCAFCFDKPYMFGDVVNYEASHGLAVDCAIGKISTPAEK